MPERKLSVAELLAFIDRTPGLAEQFTPGANALSTLQGLTPEAQRIRMGQILPEAAAVADPFAVMRIKRAMGMEMSPMELINEAHGLADPTRSR